METLKKFNRVDVQCVQCEDKILREIVHPKSPWSLEAKLAFYRKAVEWKDIIVIDVFENEYGQLRAISGWNQLEAILDSIEYLRNVKDRKAVRGSQNITIVLKTYGCENFTILRDAVKLHNIDSQLGYKLEN